MNIKILAQRAGLTEVSVKEAARILGNKGGEFDIRMKLKKGEADYGFAEKQDNGKYKYVVYRELLEREQNEKVFIQKTCESGT